MPMPHRFVSQHGERLYCDYCEMLIDVTEKGSRCGSGTREPEGVSLFEEQRQYRDTYKNLTGYLVRDQLTAVEQAVADRVGDYAVQMSKRAMVSRISRETGISRKEVTANIDSVWVKIEPRWPY